MARFVSLLFLSFIGTVLYGQNPPSQVSNGINSLFQGHVSQTAGLVPGHVIRLEKPNNWVYTNAAGVSSISPVLAAQADQKFKIASITKLFTTVAIFKLVQNGQINLNAPISTYLPLSVVQGFNNYQSITVKKLLSHTSGISEPQIDFQGRLNYWIYMKRFDPIPIDSLIFWSYANPKGVGNYCYSNSNFYLLAEIIRSVTGTTYQSYISSTIINPLGLTNTDFNTVPKGNFMRGYLKGSFYPIGGVINGGLDPDSLYDFTEASNSWGYGAADIWSNTTDLISFHKALFSGRIINSNWVDTMKVLVTNTGDMGNYGYGMIQFKSFNGGPVYGFGHTGSAFGYGSMLCYIPSLDVYMCSAGNYMKIGQEFLQRDIYNFLNQTIASTSLTTQEAVINAYPNPSTDQFTLQTTLTDFQLTLFDLNGKEVFSGANEKSIDMRYLKKGMFLLRVIDNRSNAIYTQRILHL